MRRASGTRTERQMRQDEPNRRSGDQELFIKKDRSWPLDLLFQRTFDSGSAESLALLRLEMERKPFPPLAGNAASFGDSHGAPDAAGRTEQEIRRSRVVHQERPLLAS